ncbi:MAG: aldehyde dehydrogenase family protein [Myxococcales bacterium]|nr:aldehyde dehydrogenase family protein [Myxococcales bacterium]
MSLDLLARLGLASQNPGVWLGDRATGSGPALLSFNPATGEPIAEVQTGTADELAHLLGEAAAAAAAWQAVPAPRRGEAVRLIGEALRRHRDDLGSLVSLEMGKIRAEGIGEVQEMIDIADYAVGLSRMIGGRTLPSERPDHRMFEQWHPLGVVAVITAFNFPVAVWAWNACLAAICGDVTVWRPSPHAPLCAIAVQRLVNAALAGGGFPPAFYLFCEAGTEHVGRLLDDRRVPLVSFTGSTPVGRQVAARVAGRLGRTLLELGGNNAVVVDATADLDLVERAVLFGAVGTAGQRCTSTRRLLVERSVADALVERLAAAYAQVPIGDPLAPGTLLGPLIDAAAVARFEAAVSAARAQGGLLVCGGGGLPRAGHFVRPAILRMPAQTPVVREETFGPILYVIPWDTLDEAITLQNEVAHGLSSAIFTRDLEAAERFLAATGSDCGIANVNLGTSGAEIGGAFGGEKDTGGGREAGSDSWKAYMRRQTCTINHGRTLPLAQGITFGAGPA